MLRLDIAVECRLGPVPTHTLSPSCLQTSLEASGKKLALLSPPPPITLQFSHVRGLQSEEGFLKYRLPGSTSGISGSNSGLSPRIYISNEFPADAAAVSFMATLRTTAPDQMAFSSVLPWPVQLFYSDFYQADNSCVFSAGCELL